MDDRVDMFPADITFDYGRLAAGAPGWSERLDRYGIGFVVWAREEGLTQILSEAPGWRTLYHDPEWVVFCRRELPSCADA